MHREGAYSAEVMREMRALGDDQDVGFSFRWFSRFYQLGERASRDLSTDNADVGLLESNADAANAVLAWWHASSELFANLFEDWMRGDKMVGWDECEPESLSRSVPSGHPSVRIALLPDVAVETVRAETYRLFTGGIRRAVDQPPVRPGLFGDSTDESVNRLRTVIATVRTEQR